MLCWIHDMLGMTEQSHKNGNDEELFQSALRSMVVTTQLQLIFFLLWDISAYTQRNGP